ncbi:McrB family protein [Psychrobacillus sp. NPDC093180]|uniref:McrB family protein n=1 Tax=Psychrobacillus sp. NPDC093180 TaxID=3364489 RepID=UPI0038026A2F
MLNKVWSPYVIGVLTNETSHYSGRNIFVNNNKDLQFYIKILSTPPHSFPNSQKDITSYGSELKQHGFEDEFFESDRRIHSLENFLEDNLVVFQIEKRSTSTDEFYRAKNINLLYKKSSFTEQMSFFPIPLFTEEDEKKSEQDFTQEEFVQQLKQGKYIGRNEYVSQEPDDTPRFVLYKNKKGQYLVFGEFESHQYAHGGFSFTNSNGGLKHVALPEELVKEIYFFKDVAFISVDLEHAIMEILQDRSITALGEGQIKKEQQLGETNSLEKTIADKNTSNVIDNIEETFMLQFIAETKKMMLGYNLEDLYNFHTAVKASGLVILAGMSGTGKSQLVNAYQKALNLDSDKFLMVPVSPTWADDSDLVGYPDIINNVYRAADSGLVKLLIEAQKYPTETFLVCFDEMNLAKVEHYFSQFLSVLEMEKGKRRLRLYNSDLQNKFYNGADYTPELLIGDNVIFTGTVNFDESTHHFSDKVLDRCNMIQLKVEPFTNLLTYNEKITDKPEIHKPSYDINEFINYDKKITLSPTELELLWEFHLLLNKVSDSMGIGPRIVKHIDRYVKNLSSLKECPITRGDAIDIQIVQRVLPKLRGSEEVMKSLIGSYEPEIDEIIHSQIVEILTKYSLVSEFSRTRHELLNKSKELSRHGYTI